MSEFPTDGSRKESPTRPKNGHANRRKELPLIDALRTTAFQLRRVLANRPVNEDRLLALVDRQEQNMPNYEAWMAAHDRMKEEVDCNRACSGTHCSRAFLSPGGGASTQVWPCSRPRSGGSRWLRERRRSHSSLGKAHFGDFHSKKN